MKLERSAERENRQQVKRERADEREDRDEEKSDVLVDGSAMVCPPGNLSWSARHAHIMMGLVGFVYAAIGASLTAAFALARRVAP